MSSDEFIGTNFYRSLLHFMSLLINYENREKVQNAKARLHIHKMIYFKSPKHPIVEGEGKREKD